MKQFLLCLVLMTTVIRVATAEMKFIEIGRTSPTAKGLIVERGYVLKRPYIFETDVDYSTGLWVRVDHDQHFKSQGVVRLPLNVTEPVATAPVSDSIQKMLPDDPNIFARRNHVDSLAMVAYGAATDRGERPGQAIRAAVQVYGLFPDVADSARAFSSAGYVRYWAGCPFMFIMNLPPAGNAPTSLKENLDKDVQERLRQLDHGYISVIGPAGLEWTPDLRPEQFAASVDSLKLGQGPLVGQTPDLFENDLKHPKTASALAQLARRRLEER